MDAILEATRDVPFVFNLGHGIPPETPDLACRSLDRAGEGRRREARRRPVHPGGPDIAGGWSSLSCAISSPIRRSSLLPAIVRLPLGRFIAKRRAPLAREIYAKIGGRARRSWIGRRRGPGALERALLRAGHAGPGAWVRRHALLAWPFGDEAAAAVKDMESDLHRPSLCRSIRNIDDDDGVFARRLARAARWAGLTAPQGTVYSIRRAWIYRGAGGFDPRDLGEDQARTPLSPASVRARPARARYRQGRSLSEAGRADCGACARTADRCC